MENKKLSTSNQENTDSYKRMFAIPLATFLAMTINMGELKADNQENLVGNLKQTEISAGMHNNNHTTIKNLKETFDKDTVAQEYLKNNLFVKGNPIINKDFNHSLKQIDKDLYELKYSHPFEGIPNFSLPSKKEVSVKIKFTYKDNNIFIEVSEVNIGVFKLQDNGILLLENTIYDYDISQGVNKGIEINSKANPDKTFEMIKEKISNTGFSFLSTIENIKEFENTQLTKLNDLSLGKEVSKEGEFFYREIFMTENGQYRPITKVYFDKYGNLDLTKTNEKQEKTIILGVDIKFEITETNGNIKIKMNQSSIDKLKNKVLNHRKSIIGIIDKAKIGSNQDFKGFNKVYSTRVWSEKEEWLFDTKLVSLELINDTYLFQRGDKNQSLSFGIESKEGGDDNIYLKNLNNQKVIDFFTTTGTGFYGLSIKENATSISKIKKEGENITNNLPTFVGDKNITSILANKDINTYYDLPTTQLEYQTNNGKLAASIPFEKSEDGNYKLKENSISVNINDLYTFPEFTNTVNEIKKTQKKLNTLDIDIVNSLELLLKKLGVDLDNQNLVKVVNEKGDVFYCTVKQTKDGVEISKDDKLYNSVEKALKILKSRLEIADKLNNTKIKRTNKGKEEDFTKFVGGGWGIGTRFIAQSDIINFISNGSNELTLVIQRGEGETTKITSEISKKHWKIIFSGKSKISMNGIMYKLKVDEQFNLYLDPIEKKIKTK